MLRLSLSQARRLAVHAQALSGSTANAGAPEAARLLAATRRLGCLQLDPISAVARSHQLVLFSRVGPYDLGVLDRMLWEDRALFEYWAHCASIVLTEDFPIHQARMRGYLNRPQSAWGRRRRQWVQENHQLKRYILTQLKRRGPLLSRELEADDVAPQTWVSTGWTSGRNVSQMLDYLWLSGQIMVARREGLQKAWDLAERCRPAWTPRERLTERAATRRAIEIALRALGVATGRQIQQHFVRGRYPHFAEALADLERAGRVLPATVAGWREAAWLSADYAPQLDTLAQDWRPRTTLLSPFDNLICDRARTAALFDFDFRIEIYTPPAKRRDGYSGLPIWPGDHTSGRGAPLMDRAAGRLTVNAVYAEPGAPREAGPAVAAALAELAAFLRAGEINFDRRRLPAAWKRALLA